MTTFDTALRESIRLQTSCVLLVTVAKGDGKELNSIGWQFTSKDQGSRLRYEARRGGRYGNQPPFQRNHCARISLVEPQPWVSRERHNPRGSRFPEKDVARTIDKVSYCTTVGMLHFKVLNEHHQVPHIAMP